jgi:hypothetical protein
MILNCESESILGSIYWVETDGHPMISDSKEFEVFSKSYLDKVNWLAKIAVYLVLFTLSASSLLVVRNSKSKIRRYLWRKLRHFPGFNSVSVLFRTLLFIRYCESEPKGAGTNETN